MVNKFNENNVLEMAKNALINGGKLPEGFEEFHKQMLVAHRLDADLTIADVYTRVQMNAWTIFILKKTVEQLEEQIKENKAVMAASKTEGRDDSFLPMIINNSCEPEPSLDDLCTSEEDHTMKELYMNQMASIIANGSKMEYLERALAETRIALGDERIKHSGTKDRLSEVEAEAINLRTGLNAIRRNLEVVKENYKHERGKMQVLESELTVTKANYERCQGELKDARQNENKMQQTIQYYKNKLECLLGHGWQDSEITIKHIDKAKPILQLNSEYKLD